MDARFFQQNAYQTSCEIIDSYIDQFIKRAIERLFTAEEPKVIYKLLALGADSISFKLYKNEINSYYKDSGPLYEEVKELFLGLGIYMHGQLEKNDLLMSSLTKTNPNMSIQQYNKLISEKISSLITDETLPRLKMHNDY